MELSDSEFNSIVTFFKDSTGIELGAKRTLITGRLNNYLIQNGYTSYEEYFRVAKNSQAERANLINRLTTNHTYFMRETVHFDFLKTVILPELKEKEKKERDIRIWSAACSTGEEPYTLSMILNDFFALESAKWDKRLLATDISTVALEKALKGVYLKEEIKVLPENWIKRYFKSIDDEQSEVVDEIKRDVIFRQFNLMNVFPFRKKFHVVFIRNVMIYFNEETRRTLINKICNYLEPGGYLIIGSTENIDKTNEFLDYVQPSIYRRKK